MDLARRRRAALRLSLSSPHPETLIVAESGVAAWRRSLATDDVDGLLEPSEAKRLSWVEGRGWRER